MKKGISTGLLLIAFAATITGCVKLSEEVTTEIIERPQYDVEIPVTPPWDGPTQPDTPETGN